MDQNKKITSQDSLKNCEIRRIMDPSIKLSEAERQKIREMSIQSFSEYLDYNGSDDPD